MELREWQRAKYINNVCKAFVALIYYNMSTDANKPEKKDRVLKAMHRQWKGGSRGLNPPNFKRPP